MRKFRDGYRCYRGDGEFRRVYMGLYAPEISDRAIREFMEHDVLLALSEGTNVNSGLLYRACLTHREWVESRAGTSGTIFVDGMPSEALLQCIVEQDERSVAWSAFMLASAIAQVGEHSEIFDDSGVWDTPIGHKVMALAQAETSEEVKEYLCAVMKTMQVAIELDELWHGIDKGCERTGWQICLLFHGLDDMLDEPERSQIIRSLIVRADASLCSRRALGAKIFLRSGYFWSNALRLEEKAKYASRTVTLR